MNARNVALKSIEAQRRRTLEKSIQCIAANAFRDGFNEMATAAANLNPSGTFAHAMRAYLAALAEVLRDSAARVPDGWRCD
jgi:hypothetical protein